MDKHIWIDDFTKKHGRPPRILHIGNIANNAYQNAKMLNQAGCDCDVLCYDYYHCMGCPEWDDADYIGDIGNTNFPAWHKVDLRGFQRPGWFVQAPMQLAVNYLIARRDGQTQKSKRLWRKMERVRRRLTSKPEYAYYKNNLIAPFLYYSSNILRYTKRAFQILFRNPHELRYKVNKTIKRWISRKKGVSPEQEEESKMPPEIAEIYQRAVDDFSKLFPDRESHIEQYLVMHIYSAKIMAPLFERYDIVEAYATCGIFPYLAGYENYVAFEHNTIFEYPQDDDGLSQLSMLAYAKAKAIYLTNVHCVPSAEYITRNVDIPIVYGLHGLDVERVRHLQAVSKESRDTSVFDDLKDAPIFFCPSRHTFDRAKGLFLKGEDMAIRAAAQLRRDGCSFHFVLVDWGGDTQMIKDMITRFPELDSCIVWISPLKKFELHQAYFKVAAVIDQFYWKAFGAIDFEVLCASSAVLISSKANPDFEKMFFSRPLPYLGCDTENDIYCAMRQVILEPEKTRMLAGEGKKWINDCHSAKMIVSKNLEAYAYCDCIKKTGEI